MQAQVEPHFLFNTLANVQHLVETDPASASRMLESLIQYLRAALPRMREDSTTVGREIDMSKAFLDIHRMRMGSRLDYVLDVPEDLRCRPFPPMMLITLVENAVIHGVDPCCEAGTITIRAAGGGRAPAPVGGGHGRGHLAEEGHRGGPHEHPRAPEGPLRDGRPPRDRGERAARRGGDDRGGRPRPGWRAGAGIFRCERVCLILPPHGNADAVTADRGRASAVIADDEPLLRAQLRARLARLWPELAIVHEMENGRDIEQVVATHAPSLFFLDIHMPGVNGLEAARVVGKRAHVVFVTAFDQYAVEAFEQGAIDYVLKPFNEERLATTVERLRERLSGAPPAMDDLVERLASRLAPRATATTCAGSRRAWGRACASSPSRRSSSSSPTRSTRGW